MLERNYMPFEKKGRFYIKYEYWNHITDEWETTIFRDYNRDPMFFATQDTALEWCKRRTEIVNL